MEVHVDFDCPECGAAVKATTRDVAHGRTVTCRRGHRLHLQDDGGGARKIQKSMDDLDKVLKNFGK